METPSPKYICPSCRASFDVDMHFCGKCGADMHRASSLIYRRDEDTTHGFSRAVQRAPTNDGQPDPWLGRIVDNRYRVIERIGHGGMGAVYKVEHQRMGKIAAMKVLHRELASDRDVVRRFRREAQAVSRLTHPNTVQVFDFGTAGGALYLVMEFVRGRDLGAMIKQDGPMAYPDAAPIFHQLCAALSEAHALGVIHRDVKPENILVTRTRDGDDFVKVLDFGLAKLSEREELAEVTDSGAIVGTPYYMSPEQIRGELIDLRSDLYSVGAVLYRVLTGEPPFRAQSPVGVLTKHLTAELIPPSERRPDLDIDPRVDALIARCMSKSRDRRYESADDLRRALEDTYVALTGLAAPGVSPSGGHRRRPTSDPQGASHSGPAHTPRNVSLEVDYGIAPSQRLRREDLDAYERGLRRSRLLRGLVLPVLLVGAGAGAGYWFFLRSAPPASHEREPNNEPRQATLITTDTEVTGYIGKRLGRNQPDKDIYRLNRAPAPDGSELLTASVTGLPNMDLTLQLYDQQGAFIAKADAGGVGADEWIRNYRVTTPVMLVVTEGTMRSGWPTENISDSYTLTVELSAATPGLEVEPNDMDSSAVPIDANAPITGYLDRRGDIDAYKFTGAAGRYQVTVTGADNVPLRLRHGSDAPQSSRSAVLPLATGDIIRVERDEASSQPRAIANAAKPYQLTLSPTK